MDTSLSERLAARGADLRGLRTCTTESMPQPKKLRERGSNGGAPVRTAAMLEEGELCSWTLPHLKKLAKLENMDEGWQHITKVHRDELVTELESLVAESRTCLRSVQKASAAIARDAADVAMTESRGKWKGTNAERSTLSGCFPGAVAACVHVGVHGSGVTIPSPNEDCSWVLTNAHCVDHYNDPGEDSGEAAPDRVGRWKSVFYPDGSVYAARCIACDDTSDLALLQIATGGLPSASVSDVAALPGSTVVCVGNPGDKRFRRFYMSCGVIKSNDSGRKRNPDLGATKHSCWTYWGHSGAKKLMCDRLA